MNVYPWNGGVAPHILNLGTGRRWEVSFTHRSLYSQEKNPRYLLDRSPCVFIGVTITIKLRAGRSRRSGFDSRRRLGIFLFATASEPAAGPTQPPIQRVPWVKRPGREADHSHPSSAVILRTETTLRYVTLRYSSCWGYYCFLGSSRES
jgi:hypothetical protein